ncbi:polysaccharide deacetylase family protein [Runella sp.]|uniref:polysaccharide deacetylase family protein n=1 Tax=Runella sp. TaxID=1960881 RepID=UPI003D0C991A
MARLLLIIFAFAGLTNGLFAQSLRFPNGAKAAICLTYDDGMSSQIQVAIPQLDRAGLKGTFFLNGQTEIPLVLLWRKAAQNGHELANHSLFHPCESWKNEWASANYTNARMIREMAVLNTELFLIDNKTEPRSYAYPCSEVTLRGKSYVDTLRQTGIVRYARIGGDNKAVITDFQSLDSLLVPSYAVAHGTSGEQLIDFAKQTEAKGGLGVFMFHGIGNQWIVTPNESHQKLVDYLAQNKDKIWVATFSEIMTYVTDWQKKHPKSR